MRAGLERQRGNALIFVITIGLVVTIAFAMFMRSTVVVEERAVEGSLAKSRAYWAEMGNFNYALSRISYSRLCNGCSAGSNADAALATVLQAYFTELGNNKTWSYADESSNYTITTTDTAGTNGTQTYSGWLTATSTYSSSSLVAASSGSLPQLYMGLCVGLALSTSSCSASNLNNGGNATVYFSINNLANLPAP